MREIKDIYNFYNKYRNKNNLKYFTDRIGDFGITEQELSINFRNNEIKPDFKINQIMLIYFHKNIINWYKNPRTGLDITISPDDFIKMCLLPIFRPFIITQVRTKFSEFYKKNISLHDKFEILDNRYTTKEKQIDMIHRINIDELLKTCASKIGNKTKEVLELFEEFIRGVDDRIERINYDIERNNSYLIRPVTEKTYVHRPTERYTNIDFFNKLEDDLSDIKLLQNDISKFDSLKRVLPEEQGNIFRKIKESFNQVKENFKKLNDLDTSNRNKNNLLNQYIRDNIKDKFLVMFEDNSLRRFKWCISTF